MADLGGKMKSARISLIITGEEITAEEITSALGLEPTMLLKKGDIVSRLPMLVAAQSEWRHAQALSKPIGPDPSLDDFLQYLLSHQPALMKLEEAGMTVTLRLYVQSDAIEMSYQLMPTTLSLLSRLNRTLEVSSLSWGEF